MTVRHVTILVIAITILVLGVYDVWALLRGGAEATISVVIWDGAKEYPMIPFLFGVLIGHFFWQNEG